MLFRTRLRYAMAAMKLHTCPDVIALPSLITVILVTVIVGKVEEALSLEADVFKERYGVAKPTQDADVIFHCKAGARSLVAMNVANKLGFSRLALQKLPPELGLDRKGIQSIHLMFLVLTSQTLDVSEMSYL